jgi:uncharacterized membrane protein (GlpM family)
MLYTIIKLIVSAGLIVLISELAKRQSLFAALLASLPLTSILAFIWIYVDTGDLETIQQLSGQIFWLVIPSLVLFILMPWCIRQGMGFWLSLLLSSGATALSTFGMTLLLRQLGIKL